MNLMNNGQIDRGNENPRPGADQSSKAAFGKSAFAKSAFFC